MPETEERKPFMYAAELLLNVTKNLGEITDSLLEGKVSLQDLQKWAEVVPLLNEVQVELAGAYITSGAAADDFLADVRRELELKESDNGGTEETEGHSAPDPA